LIALLSWFLGFGCIQKRPIIHSAGTASRFTSHLIRLQQPPVTQSCRSTRLHDIVQLLHLLQKHRTVTIVAAAVAYPHMLPGSESMGAPSSFSSRRPNASHLPQFELPPPTHSSYGKYPPSYPPSIHSNQHSSSLTSVGNLLTPPSGSSLESPSTSTGVTTGSSASTQSMAPYTPNGYSWSQSSSAPTAYGYNSSMSPSVFAPSKGLFAPSVNSLHKSELPPPPYGNDMSSYPPLSAPINLPSLPSHPSLNHQMSNGASSVSQPSPHAPQGTFARPLPTPSYSYSSHHSSTPSQTHFSYPGGPAPIQQSPVSAGGALSNMSPASAQGSIPSLHPQNSHSHYIPQRPFSYPLPGPVLSNIGHPNSQMALVGGMPGGNFSGYNSGHAAQMHQLYHAPQPASATSSDRPFKCDQCPQSFNRNHDLKRHKRIHLAVKPFPCGHCDKSFSRKDALKVCTASRSNAVTRTLC